MLSSKCYYRLKSSFFPLLFNYECCLLFLPYWNIPYPLKPFYSCCSLFSDCQRLEATRFSRFYTTSNKNILKIPRVILCLKATLLHVNNLFCLFVFAVIFLIVILFAWFSVYFNGSHQQEHWKIKKVILMWPEILHILSLKVYCNIVILCLKNKKEV